MPVKTILVCLTTPEHAEALMAAAVPLARRHGAHLIGLHTLEALDVHPGVALYITKAQFKSFRESQKETAEKIREVFEERTKNEVFVSEWRQLDTQSKTAADRMIQSARAADLVIMAHEDKKTDRYDQRHIQAAVIRQSGRPVIVVPTDYSGPEIGKTILMGWSDTREAARAAHDALSIADENARFLLLRVKDRASDELQDADLLDLCSAVSRHGHDVKLLHTECHGSAISEALLKKGFEEGADLVVTGAFGHSAAYDFVVGATTSALLKTAKLPVLFSK
ncbi:MAG: universal stress protein [Pseudomonadota bacterium]